jgi:uncharacterized membrane protein (UPF0127 family)
MFVNPTKKITRKPVSIMNEKSDLPVKPVFRKDGELRFLHGKTSQPISVVDIEIADSDAEREQGLMYRDSMPENAAMLFLMEMEETQSFWMKNTILPLDIIYVNADRRIVSINKNSKPFSLDPISSEKPALFVVEVNAGYSDRHGIKVDDLISF